MVRFPEQKDYFVGVDSDGCAFDTMELKHRQVFIPQAIESLDLHDIDDEYRKVAESVNLYSRSRGANRFEALALCLDRLRLNRSLVKRVPDPDPIWAFVRSGQPLSNDSFAEYVETHDTDLMRRVLHWSSESNRRIAETVVDNPPFSGVREMLSDAHDFANTMIVSATPGAALRQEWGAAQLLADVDVIAGQEAGSKKTQLASAMETGFETDKALMVGDAPGDHAAADANGILFFPIVPGHEVNSWLELRAEGLARLREGRFRGSYQDGLLQAYYDALDGHRGA